MGDGTPSAIEATHCMVVMVTAVNGNWKLPVSYYFVHTLTGLQRAKLLKAVIHSVNETGVIIMGLTADNPSTNISMFENLGAKLKVDNLKVTLDVLNGLGKPIYVILDVCHCLKLVRNTFADKAVLLNGDDQTIRWNLIEELNKLQQSTGVHIANKLSNKHMNFQNNKMNVPIATQTLSTSVAKAIEFSFETLKLQQFKNYEATSEFIIVFDTVFDILNSFRDHDMNYKEIISYL